MSVLFFLWKGFLKLLEWHSFTNKKIKSRVVDLTASLKINIFVAQGFTEAPGSGLECCSTRCYITCNGSGDKVFATQSWRLELWFSATTQKARHRAYVCNPSAKEVETSLMLTDNQPNWTRDPQAQEETLSQTIRWRIIVEETWVNQPLAFRHRCKHVCVFIWACTHIHTTHRSFGTKWKYKPKPLAELLSSPPEGQREGQRVATQMSLWSADLAHSAFNAFSK